VRFGAGKSAVAGYNQTMSSENERFQHLQSQIDALRKRLQLLEKPSSETREMAIGAEHRKKDRFDILNTSLLTLFTGLLFGSAMLQWQAARDAIKDTHTSFEIGTRAWMVAKEAHVKPTKPFAQNRAIVQEGEGLKDSHTPAVSAQLVNAGHSPALNVVQNTHIEILDRLPTDDYVMPLPEKSQMVSKNVIAPDGFMYANAVLALSDADINDIKTNKRFLAVYGDITYEDIFKHSRETKYCYFYSWDSGLMNYCPYYNSAK
jgi:hypothetical protein